MDSEVLEGISSDHPPGRSCGHCHEGSKLVEVMVKNVEQSRVTNVQSYPISKRSQTQLGMYTTEAHSIAEEAAL